jgi:prepilin-type N-terminal cleavage/methylation domain-containing protein
MKIRTILKGFTLVELLVVISIIALLLSIMMPALQKARELSRRVTCTAHLHQQGIALSAYGTTYNKFPPSVVPGGWPMGMGRPAQGGSLTSNTPPWLPAGQAVLLKEKFLADARNLFCPNAKTHRLTYEITFRGNQMNPAINPLWPDGLNYMALWINYPYWVTWVPFGSAGLPTDYSPEKDVVQLKITSQGPTSRGDTVAISDLTVTDQETGEPAGVASLGVWINHWGGKTSKTLDDAGSRGKVLGGNTLYNDGSVKWVSFSEMKNNTKKHVTRERYYSFYFWF